MGFDYFLNDRKEYILHLLEQKGEISTAEVCDRFHLAPSTARKLLKDMNDEKLLIRTFGGAISIDHDRDVAHSHKMRLHAAAKKAIAMQALKYIRPGETIGFGGGTTVMALAELCTEIRGLIALTDSIAAAEKLNRNEDTEVRICSGIIQKKTSCIIGPTAADMFKNTSIDKVFLGADGIDAQKGIYSSNILVGKVEECMANAAKEVYILCDSSKLDISSVMPVYPIMRVHKLITDHSENSAFISELRKKGVDVDLVKII